MSGLGGRWARPVVMMGWLASAMLLSGCPFDECETDKDCGDGEPGWHCYQQTYVRSCLRTICADGGVSSDEVCDGVDNDCDGQVDEGCAVNCVDGGVPGEEVCDRVDNDCDGRIDEGLDVPMACQVGGSAAPQCQGVIRCADGIPTACERTSSEPLRAEECNGEDDDCDGTVDFDEDMRPLSRACPIPGGLQGRQECVDVEWGPCTCGGEDGIPDPELCNGGDDDCDGRVDEADAESMIAVPPGLMGVAGAVVKAGDPCSAGIGACARSGRVECQGLRALGCGADPGMPGAEVCNGPGDEDCDGRTDENGNPPDGVTVPPGFRSTDVLPEGPDGQVNLGEPCTSGIGACESMGRVVCAATGDVFACEAPVITPMMEVCNGVDDDCDGCIDGTGGTGSCVPLPPRPCPRQTNLGICVAGAQACAGGMWGMCIGAAQTARDEVCDGLNNDCDGPEPGDRNRSDDGVVDEACSCRGSAAGALPTLLSSAALPLRSTHQAGDARENTLTGSCGGAFAREAAATFSAPAAGQWRFRARSTGGGRDPVLYVTNDCDERGLPGTPGMPPEDELDCNDDRGALAAPGDAPPDAAIDRFEAAAAATLALREEVTVVVDGAQAADEGQWELDAKQIDQALCEGNLRRKEILIERRGAVLAGDDLCAQERVVVDKAAAGAAVVEGEGLCIDNDGGWRAVRLDVGDRGPLAPRETMRVQARLLPRVVDEADWYSIRLDPQGQDRELRLRLRAGPGAAEEVVDGLLAGVEAGPFVADRRACVGRWLNLAAYVACTEGEPANVAGCVRDEITGHRICQSDRGNVCSDGNADRGLDLRITPRTCAASQPIVHFGVLRRHIQQATDCDCSDARDQANPDGCTTYELTIGLNDP